MPRGRVSQTAADRFGKTGFVPDQGVEPAIPLFHLGRGGIVHFFEINAPKNLGRAIATGRS